MTWDKCLDYIDSFMKSMEEVIVDGDLFSDEQHREVFFKRMGCAHRMLDAMKQREQEMNKVIEKFGKGV